MPNLNPVIVVGGGGHAKSVISNLRKLGCFKLLGYTDLSNNGDIFGCPYLGNDLEIGIIAAREAELSIVLGVGQVGTGLKRQQIWMGLEQMRLRFPSAISPDSTVNEGVTMREGVAVMDGAVINSGSSIGLGVIVNTNSTVEHDAVISDWVHIASGATICGGATVGRFSMVGAGATVIEGIKIAEGCVIGAGAVVVGDLTEPGIYIGVPVHKIK
jgi:sugar O-acyltransferase (sialic acid O-acetyltransferase NeuD family)